MKDDDKKSGGQRREGNMVAVPGLPRLGRALVVGGLLLPSAALAAASGLVVQQIGPLSGSIAEAVAEDAVAAGVTMVPFSPRLDARATPIILATGKAFLARNGKRVLGLRPAERRALREAYDAGQVILLLDASTHDIEALHVLLEDGVAHESSTDPVVLAYALRQENDIATARVVTHPLEDDFDGEDFDEAELEVLSRALEIVIEELTLPPAAMGLAALDTASSTDWKSSPVQKFILTSSDRGTYNTPVEIYALHACDENKDYYLVDTGGTWTPTQARYQSAASSTGTLAAVGRHQEQLSVTWEDNSAHCDGGLEIFKGIFGGADNRICRYRDYPLYYQVDIVPPAGPTVVQVNAAPAGDQGQSTSYTSGVSFSIGGDVEVSGEGPSAGLQAGISWDNSITTDVPALVVEAGDEGNQGTFTRYRYCTAGTTVQDCTSNIQMIGQAGSCRQFVVGQPQNGQTPDGRLSNVAQTVRWQVDPATYTGATFDITVSFQAELATSTSNLWTNPFYDVGTAPPQGPTGGCNTYGCSCAIDLDSNNPVKLSYTFKVPLPSSSQCPS
jgi:hypothetical protein